jgi:hypothetical protein
MMSHPQPGGCALSIVFWPISSFLAIRPAFFLQNLRKFHSGPQRCFLYNGKKLSGQEVRS